MDPQALRKRRRTEQVLHERTSLLQLQHVIAAAANEASTIDEALEAALDLICSYTGWPMGHALFTGDGGHHSLVFTGLWHGDDSTRFAPLQKLADSKSLICRNDLAAEVFKTGKPTWTADIAEKCDCEWAKVAREVGLGAALAFPVWVGKETVAVLEFFSEKLEKPDEQLLQVLNYVGTQLGRTIERKRAEEALRGGEERFRALIENTNDIVSILDKNGVILFESPSIKRILGYTQEELVGKSAFDLIHPDDRERALAVFTQVLEKPGNSARCEFHFRHKDGSWRTLEAVGKNPLEGAKVSGIIINSRDITDRKHIEETLRRSERRLRQAQTVGRIGDWEFDVATQQLRWSEQMLALFGLGLADGAPTYEKFLSYVAADDAPRLRQLVQRAIETGEGFETDLHFNMPNGPDVHQFCVCIPVKDSAGKVTKLRGVGQDITARKQAEMAFAEGEQKYRVLIEQSPDAIITADQHWNIRFVNPAGCEMLGYTQEELLRLNIADTYAPEDRDVAVRRREESCIGKTQRFERNVRRKDGTCFPAEVILHRMEEDRFQGILRDITARRQAEENLQLQSVALQAAANGIVITDRTGTILWVNPAFTTLTGYTAEEAIGQNPRLLKSGKLDEKLYADLWTTITSGQVWRGEVINRRKDGSLYTEEMTVTPVGNAAGEISRFVAIKQDVTARKRAEEALRNSEAQYRALIEATDTGFVIIDQQGRVLNANAEYVRLTGRRDLNEIRNKSVIEWTAVYEKEKNAQAIQKCFSEGSVRNLEIDYVDPKGKITSIEINASVVQTGGVPLTLTLCRDITQRKRTAEALCDAEAKYRALVEQSLAGVYLFTKDGFQYSNEALAHIFGYEPHEIIGKLGPADLTQPEDRPIVTENTRKRLAGEIREIRYSFRGRRKDGSTVYCETFGQRIDYMGQPAIMGTLLDITERKQTEEAMQRMAAIVESSDDAIIGKTLDGVITSWNSGAEKLFGYSAEEITGKPVLMLVPPECANEEADIVERLKRGESVDHFETVRVRKGGQQIDVSLTISPIRDSHGNIVGASKIARDIAARKKTDEALQDANRRLEKALAELKDTQQQVIQQERLGALGTMASGIAHDFNNALAAILGFSELLLFKPDCLNDREKALRYIEMMNTAAKDAGDVVNRLREFYRHREEGEVFVPVEVNRLVEDAVSLTEPKWKSQAEASGISITVQTDLQKVPAVAGNAANLREMLTNLIFNAVDAMPHGGTITIRTHCDNGHVVLELADTGTGMTEEVRRRCLEPFFSTKGERGTGLGLSMVYGIIQRHEGEIDIQTEVGKGTTFSVRLPHHTTKLQPQPERNDQPTSHPSSLRVLVVDDEPLTRKIIGEYLKLDGHTVEMAGNGGAGLEKFSHGQFDLVVVDRAMPDMSGDQVASTIKAFSPATPIIMLTGFGSMMEAADEKPANVDLVVGKPVTIADLRRALMEVTMLVSANLADAALEGQSP